MYLKTNNFQSNNRGLYLLSKHTKALNFHIYYTLISIILIIFIENYTDYFLNLPLLSIKTNIINSIIIIIINLIIIFNIINSNLIFKLILNIYQSNIKRLSNLIYLFKSIINKIYQESGILGIYYFVIILNYTILILIISIGFFLGSINLIIGISVTIFQYINFLELLNNFIFIFQIDYHYLYCDSTNTFSGLNSPFLHVSPFVIHDQNQIIITRDALAIPKDIEINNTLNKAITIWKINYQNLNLITNNDRDPINYSRWLKGFTVNSSAYNLKSDIGIVHPNLDKLVHNLIEMLNSIEIFTKKEIANILEIVELGNIVNSIHSNGLSLQLEAYIPNGILNNNTEFIYEDTLTSLYLNGENKINLPDYDGNLLKYYLINNYTLNKNPDIDQMLKDSYPIYDFTEWCFRGKSAQSLQRLCNNPIMPLDTSKPFFITYTEVETLDGLKKTMGIRMNLHTPSALDNIFKELRVKYLTGSSFIQGGNYLTYSMYELEWDFYENYIRSINTSIYIRITCLIIAFMIGATHSPNV